MTIPRRLLPSTSALRAFEALDRLGTASAVADELSLTQSAVSRQVQTLERQLGVTLVRRERKRLVLTPAARAFASEARAALAQIGNAALKLQVQPMGGTLNLAILPTFGMQWLMPRLPDFARRHPEITLNLTSRLEPFNFAMEGIDAAIFFGAGDWPGTGRLLLKSEAILPVCAPQLLSRKPPRRALDLLTYPLMHIRTRPDAWAHWFTQQGVTLDAPLPGTIHDQFATITQAALHGLGIALMPVYLVEQDLAAGRLVRAFGEPVEARGAYYLVWPDAGAAPAVETFRDWLATQAEPEDRLPR